VDLVRAGQQQASGVSEPRSAEATNCCRVIVAAVTLDPRTFFDAANLHSPCCRVVDVHEIHLYPMCAPWGPPVPPAIDWEAAA
jgi:hypothetical protein